MPRLLLIEDNPDDSELVSLLLGRSGWEVEVVSTGVDAWEAVTSSDLDLILMDIRIPAPDGVQLMAGRRFDVRAPVVAVTAGEDSDDLIDAGFDGVIRKPIDPVAFEAQVAAFVSSA